MSETIAFQQSPVSTASSLESPGATHSTGGDSLSGLSESLTENRKWMRHRTYLHASDKEERLTSMTSSHKSTVCSGQCHIYLQNRQATTPRLWNLSAILCSSRTLKAPRTLSYKRKAFRVSRVYQVLCETRSTAATSAKATSYKHPIYKVE